VHNKRGPQVGEYERKKEREREFEKKKEILILEWILISTFDCCLK